MQENREPEETQIVGPIAYNLWFSCLGRLPVPRDIVSPYKTIRG